MNVDTDFGTFERAFRRFCGAYREKGKPSEMEELTLTYFRALEHAPLEQVLAAGKTLIQTHRRGFPRAADWIAALPKSAAVSSDVRLMSEDEAREWLSAMARNCQGDPCACGDCQQAGVSHRFLRFVPDVNDDRIEWAVNPLQRHERVNPGHWAHGFELARWYAARDRFFAVAGQLPALRSRLHELALTTSERVPGEEG